MEESSLEGQVAGRRRMNSTLIGAIGIGVVIVAGAVFLMRGSNEEGVEMLGTKEENGGEFLSEAPEGMEAGMSLRDLLGMGKSQKCVFKNESDGVKSEGTFYISDGKSRAMISNTVSGTGSETITSNMIFDTASNTTYLWDETTKEGIKMAMNDMSQTDVSPSNDDETERMPDISTSDDFARELDQKYVYDCDSWKTDESLFVVPSDVAFVDMTEMTKALPNSATLPGSNPSGASTTGVPVAGSDDAKATSCAVCDQAGDQKESCREALGC